MVCKIRINQTLMKINKINKINNKVVLTNRMLN
jgi:hypothetical protein